MPKNVGENDRALRIFFGFAIIFVGILAKSWIAIVGIILALTGMVGYSLAYAALNLSTAPKKAVVAAKLKTKKKLAKKARRKN